METSHCALVVAIEFPVPESGAPARPNSYFERALAQPLANQLAFELGKQLPSLDGLGLVWMAACYDQAQILRPELPVHAALADLYVAATRNLATDGAKNGAQVMTLQALRGEAPVPALKVDERLLGGAMVLLPFAIVGAVDRVNQARTILEEKLLDTGLTDARTALMLNQALGCDAEHARLMTLDDLAAMCAMQLEHAGLAPVWEVLEAAIFRPNVTVSTQIGCAALHWHERKLSIETSGPGSLFALANEPTGKLFALANEPTGKLSLAEYSDQVLQARQASAVLAAHGITATEKFCASATLEVGTSFWIDWFTDAPVSEIKVFSDPRLGVVLYQLYDAQNTLIGLVFPRLATAHRDVLRRFADQAPRVS